MIHFRLFQKSFWVETVWVAVHARVMVDAVNGVNQNGASREVVSPGLVTDELACEEWIVVWVFLTMAFKKG
jgi:hypothetical protein